MFSDWIPSGPAYPWAWLVCMVNTKASWHGDVFFTSLVFCDPVFPSQQKRPVMWSFAVGVLVGLKIPTNNRVVGHLGRIEFHVVLL